MTRRREASSRKPRPWAAALLSVLSPGLGHVYAGRVLAAAGIVAAIDLVAKPILTVAIQRAPAATLGALVLLIPAGLAAVAVHAARAARRPTERFGSRGRAAAACAAFVLASTAVGAFAGAARDRWLGAPFRVPSAAMEPSLRIGDHFYSDARAYRSRDPQRGDVALFRIARDGMSIQPADRRPDLPVETFVKRVVGLPGDTVELDGAVLRVNGDAVTGPRLDETFTDAGGRRLALRSETLGARSYPVLDDPASSPRPPLRFVVEPDRYFVAGDNRLHSNDSRVWGTVHRDDFVGAVSSVYWSWDFEGAPVELLSPATWLRLLRHHTRWDRIGLAP